MELHTKIPLQKQSNNLIDYQSNILLLGSCFVENIGKKLEYFKFQNLINPFGILFHPLAIENLISNAVQKKEYAEKDIFFHNEQWHCYNAHSKLSDVSKDNLIKELNKQLDLTHNYIKDSSHIIITLGTAWVYKHIETKAIVANCHKVPQKQFAKEILSIEEIKNSIKKIIDLIGSVNHKATIIFTVSPVRHIKDGFIENTQSKAHLITAIQSVLSPRAQSRDICYFPSYEIMLDELRDYRFYDEDMIHPNETAISYIWEKFQQVWTSSQAQETMNDVEYIQKGLLHEAFNPNSDAHLKFLQDLENKKQDLNFRHSYIVF